MSSGAFPQRVFWKQSCDSSVFFPDFPSATPRLWRLLQSLRIWRHVSGDARAQWRFLHCFPGQLASLLWSMTFPGSTLTAASLHCPAFLYFRQVESLRHSMGPGGHGDNLGGGQMYSPREMRVSGSWSTPAPHKQPSPGGGVGEPSA